MLKSISKYNFRATHLFPKLLKGEPVEGGIVDIFKKETTIPLETFSDFDGINKNTQPIYLTENGEANIYYDKNEKITVLIRNRNRENIITFVI